MFTHARILTVCPIDLAISARNVTGQLREREMVGAAEAEIGFGFRRSWPR
jgi:hypothetical protein